MPLDGMPPATFTTRGRTGAPSIRITTRRRPPHPLPFRHLSSLRVNKNCFSRIIWSQKTMTGSFPPTAGTGFCAPRHSQHLYHHHQDVQPPTIYRDPRRPAQHHRGQPQRHSALTTTAAEFDFSTMSSAGTSLAPPSSSPPPSTARAEAGRVSEDDYFISIARDGSVIKPIPVSEL